MRKHLLFVGGGTAGHVAPLLAVMDAVHAMEPEIRLSYVGTSTDVTSPLVAESILPFDRYMIRAGKFHRYLTLDLVIQMGRAVRGVQEAYTLLRKLQPDAILAKGGFVSVPIVLAAVMHGIPVYTHESDSIPGLANRMIGKIAKHIFTSYPVSAYAGMSHAKLQYTGQPVRPEFAAPQQKLTELLGEPFSTDLPVVLIICGSQGSARVNELVSECWQELLEVAQVVHLTGPTHVEALQNKVLNLTQKEQERLWLLGFVTDELPALLQQSDVVVSRAGGTIAELAATGRPAVLIPLSTAAQDHQRANAQFLQRSGAALVLDETLTTAKELAAVVTHLLAHPLERQVLSQAISAFYRPKAAREMAQILIGKR